MGFANDTGYAPLSIDQLMTIVMGNINTQFAAQLTVPYTMDTFLATNFYKYFYALMQRLQESEVKTAEIFLELQDYFAITNEKISRPATTGPGVIEQLGLIGFLASVKPPADADAGKIFICVDTDGDAPDYAAQKLIIAEKIRDCVSAGIVSQGSEVTALVLTNGQSFNFKFALPNEIPVLLKLSTTLSENNQFVIKTPEEQKQILIDNIAAKYALGHNFEPQRYFSLIDAPWASDVKLEWSDDAGANWHTTVYDADFDDIFTFGLGDITLIES